MKPTDSKVAKMRKKIKHRSHYKKFHELAIPLVEKFGTKHILDFPKEFKEFWDLYFKTYEEEPNKRGDWHKNKNFRKKTTLRLLNMVQHQKKKKCRSIALHENYIKFHIETKEKQKTRALSKAKRAIINENDNLEIITKKIEKKKITEISFASSITVETVERIERETNFLKEFVNDYLEQVKSFSTQDALGSAQEKDNFLHKLDYVKLADKNSVASQSTVGETQETIIDNQKSKDLREESNASSLDNYERKKGAANSPSIGLIERNDLGGVGGILSSQNKKRSTFNFQHLTLTNQFRQKLASIADDLTNKLISGCNPRELADINKTLDTISKLIDTTRKLDLQPVYMLNQIAEGGFNRQKELQGAVVNDKSMIDNGQIVLEKVKEESQITSEDVEKDLKLIGSSLLLNTANQFAEESNTLDQEPIEAEFTTENERDK